MNPFEDWRRRNIITAIVSLVIGLGIMIWAFVDPVLPSELGWVASIIVVCSVAILWMYRRKP